MNTGSILRLLDIGTPRGDARRFHSRNGLDFTEDGFFHTSYGFGLFHLRVRDGDGERLQLCGSAEAWLYLS